MKNTFIRSAQEKRRGSLLKTAKALALLLVTVGPNVLAQAQTIPKWTQLTQIAYAPAAKPGDSVHERKHLDLGYPEGVRGFPTVVWFHGGGLTGGARHLPGELANKGVAVAAAGYRLSPDVQAPVYIEDAAEAVAWTFKNIARYGGATNRIFLSGHSAGGYLAAMLTLDKRWLAKHGIDANLIAGVIPFSGQAITHFTVRKERGIDSKQPIIDDLAPLYHVRSNAPPILLITGDREMELLGRYEENAYLWRMLKETGHPDVRLHELQGYNHGQMAEPAYPLLLKFIQAHTR